MQENVYYLFVDFVEYKTVTIKKKDYFLTLLNAAVMALLISLYKSSFPRPKTSRQASSAVSGKKVKFTE